MDTGESQRPSRVDTRPSGADRPAPADPRSESPTGGTPRPRAGQPAKGGQARPRPAATAAKAGSSGNGAKTATKSSAKGKPGAPKKRPAPAPAPTAAFVDPPNASSQVAVVEPASPDVATSGAAPSNPAVAAGGTPVDERIETSIEARTTSPGQRTNGRPAAAPAMRSLPDPVAPEGEPRSRPEPMPPPHEGRTPIELPTIVPAEPDVPTATPSTVVVPSVPVWHGEAPFPADGSDPDGTAGLPALRRRQRPARALRAPKVLPRPRRPRVRKVTRVVRHVDTWSVFKVALVFNAFIYAVCLVAGVLLWQVAQNTGTVDNVERFFETFGWESFELKGGEIYHAAWVAGLFIGVGGTGLIVLAATLFNLITDLVGGIRVTVLEEEVVVRDERGLGWRRARPQAPAAIDDSPGNSAPVPVPAAEQPG